MTVHAHGLGIDTDVIGGYSAFGFGILELFPEGIVTQFGQVVYKEVRDILIDREIRAIEVEATIIPDQQEEIRIIEIQPVNRMSEVVEILRDVLVYPVNRETTHLGMDGMILFDVERRITISVENRNCTVEKENRTIEIQEFEQ